jgi:hypothetical protein
VLTNGDMDYGADFRWVVCRNQPARVFYGDGGEVCARTTSLLEDRGHDRLGAVDGGDDDEPASAPRDLLSSSAAVVEMAAT